MRTSDDCWRVGGGELWWESLNSRTIKPRKVQPVRNLTGIQLRLHVLAGRTGAEEDPRPHSLRITGLNLLEKAGCPPWLLRVTGRWLLDCHYQYTGQDHNLLATNSTSRISNQTATPAARVPVTPFPGEAHSDSLPPHPDTREMTEPGQTQVDTTLAAEATTSSWLLPGALNTDASELTDVPNTMVGRRVKKFFPG